ncbi:acyltransferase domain-containing protein [Streptomyces sp. NPDC059913]|uniref:acyltransferase domain-containing protein n=1 Tax=unclassified Streptomyces TaxID=2593676 RepID=UPI00364D5361
MTITEPAAPATPESASAPDSGPLLLVLGAADESGLKRLAAEPGIEGRQGRVRAPEGPEFLAVAAADHTRAGRVLGEFARGVPSAQLVRGRRDTGGDAVWCFGGHGGQWPGMGRELLDSAPVFGETIDEIDALMTGRAGCGVRSLLTGSEPAEFERIERVQPATFAYQVALAKWLRSVGLRPAAVVGHSVGEIAASHISGALSLPDAVRVICLRSELLARSAGGRGAMASIGLPAPEVEEHLAAVGGRLSVAVHASPHETVVTGDAGPLDRLVTVLEGSGVRCRRVHIDAASHSHLVDGVLEELRAGAAAVRAGRPDVPWISTVAADEHTRQMVPGDAAYWVRNLRGPVRFRQAVTELADRGHRTFLEIGPHGVLTSSIRDTLTGLGIRNGRILGTCRRGASERLGALRTVGALHVAGAEVDFAELGGVGRAVCVQAGEEQ